MNVEAVGERQRRALLEVGFDIVLVDAGDVLVGHQHDDEIGAAHRFADFLDRQAGFFRLVPRSAVLAQADRDLDAGLVQIQRMGVALRAVANDANFFRLDQ